jgi:hypothetical protein
MSEASADWANFFVAEVGASAALTGLVVVAISVNLSKILSDPHLPNRAAEPLVTLVGVLALTSLGLVPGQPMLVLGLEALAVGAAILAVPLSMQLLTKPSGVSQSKWALRIFISVAGAVPIVVAGILLMSGSAGGLYWMAAGVITSLIAGVFNAWVLLIEILR